MKFQWDDAKAASNREKHGVDFEEAASAFADSFFLIFADPDHSVAEQRFLLLARSRADRLLVVAKTEWEGDVRIISARTASGPERKTYEEDL